MSTRANVRRMPLPSGGALARAGGTEVTVVHACGWPESAFVGTLETNRFLLDRSDTMLARAIRPLSDLADVDFRSLSEPSSARALQEVAVELDAQFIVIGSSHRGRLGRIHPGSTGERLLQGSSCPVAIVPHGYRDAERHDIRVITCGWDGTPEADTALLAAEELARQTSATLRVTRTLQQPTFYAFQQI